MSSLNLACHRTALSVSVVLSNAPQAFLRQPDVLPQHVGLVAGVDPTYGDGVLGPEVLGDEVEGLSTVLTARSSKSRQSKSMICSGEAATEAPAQTA